MPISTHNFESVTVLSATAGRELSLLVLTQEAEPAGIESDAQSARSVSSMKYFNPLPRNT